MKSVLLEETEYLMKSDVHMVAERVSRPVDRRLVKPALTAVPSGSPNVLAYALMAFKTHAQLHRADTQPYLNSESDRAYRRSGSRDH